MTVIVTLPAPPQPYLEARPLPATPDTMNLSGRGHRVVAIGSGLGGLIATRALKHDLVTIADVLVFLTRVAAQGKAHVGNRTSLWLQVMPTTAVLLTTLGLVVALCAKHVAAQAHRRDGR